jgi:cardiolipin synthase
VIEDRYRANSFELRLEDWMRRPAAQKAFDNWRA